jgi:hypothetical protein
MDLQKRSMEFSKRLKIEFHPIKNPQPLSLPEKIIKTLALEIFTSWRRGLTVAGAIVLTLT